MVVSSSCPCLPGFDFRQRVEQNLTSCHDRSHFLRQVMVRPQVWQILSGVITTCVFREAGDE